MTNPQIPPDVVKHFECLSVLADRPHTGDLRSVSDGLINATWALDLGDGEGVIIQRLHRIFRAPVNDDIAALVPVLKRGNVPVPDVVLTRDGATSVSLGEGDRTQVWRVLTRLPGRTVHRVESLAQARVGGAAVATFHRALSEVEHGFAFVRPNPHDTDAHVSAAAGSLMLHTEHRLHAEVAQVVGEILELWRGCPRPGELPRRIVHGDLKISNLLFDRSDHGVAASSEVVSGIVDLDTMAWGTLDLELGDMLRSWCNRGAEDAQAATLDLDIFRAAMGGYLAASSGLLSAPELDAIVPGLERICIELAARFAKDALEESYFGWSSAVAPTAGEHNVLRATNQLQLARSVATQRDSLQAILSEIAADAYSRNSLSDGSTS